VSFLFLNLTFAEIQKMNYFSAKLIIIIMKKLLFSAALVASVVSASYAQLNLPPIQTPTMTGGSVIPICQGSAGTMQVQGQLLTKVTGSFNSATVNAALTVSTEDTFANDLTILVTSSGDLQTAQVLLQIGGYTDFSTNKFVWPCAPGCESNVIGTIVSGTVNFTGISFEGTTAVLWIANGYANANPATNTGAWNITSASLGGLSLGNVSLESNAPIAVVAYPNPATDVLNVMAEGDEVVSISIIAMDGKVVSTVQGSVAQVADLTAGMYIYQAVTASGAVIRNTFTKN
jgi:hypothetical protein